MFGISQNPFSGISVRRICVSYLDKMSPSVDDPLSPTFSRCAFQFRTSPTDYLVNLFEIEILAAYLTRNSAQRRRHRCSVHVRACQSSSTFYHCGGYIRSRSGPVGIVSKYERMYALFASRAGTIRNSVQLTTLKRHSDE